MMNTTVVFTAQSLGISVTMTPYGGYTFDPSCEGSKIDVLPDGAEPVFIYLMDTHDQAVAFRNGLVAAGFDPAYCCVNEVPSPFKGLHAVIRQLDESLVYVDIIDGNGLKDGDIPVFDMTKKCWAIYSPNEAAAGGDDAGWWGDEDGWVDEESATIFSTLESKVSIPPLSLGGDAQWINMDDLRSSVKASPKAAETKTKELIGYWDSSHYHEGGEKDTEGLTFECEIHDMRRNHGQVTVDIVPESGNLDDGLYAIFEINRLYYSKEELPCLHLSFDYDNMAMSIFKQGDKYILRPEAGVSLKPTTLKDDWPAYVIE